MVQYMCTYDVRAQAAVDMMRRVLGEVEMDGVVVIGEGEKDEAPMLFCGESIGTGTGLKVDIAVDPLDGTSLVANGRNGAVAVRPHCPEQPRRPSPCLKSALCL
jgi:fructose-1,6-bisphosphatase II